MNHFYWSFNDGTCNPADRWKKPFLYGVIASWEFTLCFKSHHSRTQTFSVHIYSRVDYKQNGSARCLTDPRGLITGNRVYRVGREECHVLRFEQCVLLKLCFKHPSVFCCPERFSLPAWTPASPRTGSWHIGKHRQGNTATNRTKIIIISLLEPEEGWGTNAGFWKYTLTLPQADFGRSVFCFPLLSCSSSSASPHVLHKHTVQHHVTWCPSCSCKSFRSLQTSDCS